jgi:hypothetical protein
MALCSLLTAAVAAPYQKKKKKRLSLPHRVAQPIDCNWRLPAGTQLQAQSSSMKIVCCVT